MKERQNRGGMMGVDDAWRKDPSVQAMREVFRSIEEAQGLFFNQLDISPFDPRLRRWRERALVIFENSWAMAAKKGMAVDHESAAVLYVHALSKAMLFDGAEVPHEALPAGKGFESFLKAVLP